MIRTHRVLPVSLLLACAWPALAADVAGMVKTSSGSVFIERANKRLPALVGTEVQVADKPAYRRKRCRRRDAARQHAAVSRPASSTLVIDKFVYDSTSQYGAMSINIRKGTLAVATGKIAKKTPESIDFHTPTSVLAA